MAVPPGPKAVVPLGAPVVSLAAVVARPPEVPGGRRPWLVRRAAWRNQVNNRCNKAIDFFPSKKYSFTSISTENDISKISRNLCTHLHIFQNAWGLIIYRNLTYVFDKFMLYAKLTWEIINQTVFEELSQCPRPIPRSLHQRKNLFLRKLGCQFSVVKTKQSFTIKDTLT